LPILPQQLSPDDLSRALEIERYRRPKASENGLRLAVAMQVRHDPKFYERYKVDDKHSFSLGDPNSIANAKNYQYKPGVKDQKKNTPKKQAALEKRAKAVKLVSLPLNVIGANCGNCSMFHPKNTNSSIGYCDDPEVDMNVHSDDHCSKWINPDAKTTLVDKTEMK
jgi:hypothetical protein